MTKQEAYEKLAAYDQTQLLRFYDELNDAQKASLLSQIEALDLHILEQVRRHESDTRGEFAPLGAMTCADAEKNADYYRQLGITAIQHEKIGAVLLAGGQGTRLGFEHPKGMYNVGETHPLYIFECLIDNLMQVVAEAGVYVPLLIMTSEDNDAETRAFLAEHDYFGYDEKNIYFFVQEMAPVLDENYKILLSEKDKIAMSPNGNGGWFSSMAKSGLLDMLHERKIEWLNVFAVDNVLQRIADPCFIGATLASGAASGGKVVRKASPDERVGVLCLEDGKPSIVEYYEMTDEMRTLHDENGDLAYNFGVILNYLFRVNSLEKTLEVNLPLHKAHKAVAHLAEDGTRIVSDEPNAYKFETLVLDMIHLEDTCLPYEVVRSREFAPIKKATGTDSVETAKALLRENGITL